MKWIGKMNFADRMILMNMISAIGYGLFGSYITRAYMENLAMVYISTQSFVTCFSGYLSNKIMDNQKIKRFLFDHFTMIQIGPIIIDIMSVIMFAATRKFAIIFVIDMVVPCLHSTISVMLMDVLNSNLSGDERSKYSRKLGRREHVCYAITNLFGIAFSILFIKSNPISFGLVVFIQLFVLMVEIILTWYTTMYIYRPNVKNVHRMWELGGSKYSKNLEEQKDLVAKKCMIEIEEICKKYRMSINDIVREK